MVHWIHAITNDHFDWQRKYNGLASKSHFWISFTSFSYFQFSFVFFSFYSPFQSDLCVSFRLTSVHFILPFNLLSFHFLFTTQWDLTSSTFPFIYPLFFFQFALVWRTKSSTPYILCSLSFSHFKPFPFPTCYYFHYSYSSSLNSLNYRGSAFHSCSCLLQSLYQINSLS